MEAVDRLMHQLIGDMFLKHFSNSILNEQTDSAILEVRII